jgi:hypothetical protein
VTTNIRGGGPEFAHRAKPVQGTFSVGGKTKTPAGLAEVLQVYSLADQTYQGSNALFNHAVRLDADRDPHKHHCRPRAQDTS